MKALRALPLGLILLVLGAGVLVPAFAVLREGLGEAASGISIRAIVIVTALQATVSTGLAVVLGLPLGLLCGALAARGADRRGRWLRAARALLAIPYGVPTIVVATAWVACLGRSSWLVRTGLAPDWLYSFKAVVLAHVLLNIPWVALRVAYARQTVSARPFEDAALLGAGPLSRFRFVLWPELQWELAAGACQIFALCSMSFSLVLLLGGGPPVETLETALFARIRYGELDLAAAARCASAQLSLTLVPWLSVLAFERKARRARALAAIGSSEAGAWRGGEPLRGERLWAGVVLGCAILLVAPYFSVLGGVSWHALLEPGAREEVANALGVSLQLALGSAAGTIALCTVALLAVSGLGRRAGFEAGLAALLAIPSGVSMLVLGLGFWLAYGAWFDFFSGSLIAIIVLQSLLFLPLPVRILWPLARDPQVRLLEAARMLGARPFQAFSTVEWPRWRGPLLAASAMVAGASIGEYSAASLFISESRMPLPLLVSRWMGQYRFEAAQSVAALLLLLSAGIVAAVMWGGDARRSAEAPGERVR